MKTLNEHRKILLEQYRKNLEAYSSLFDLRMKMMEERICPKCGMHSILSDMENYFVCSNPITECNFKISDKEFNLIKEGRKGILKNKIKKSKTIYNPVA